jgi:adhesin transport system outer membrane protein
MKKISSYLALISILTVAPVAVKAQEQKNADPQKDGLSVALRLAVTQHPSVKSKLSDLRSLGYDIESAQARRYPTFSLQGSTNNDVQSQVIARLQQPLWVGGRIDGGIKLTEAKHNSSIASLLQLRRQLIEQTAAVYASLQGARQRLKTADLNVAEHEKLNSLISRRQIGSIASEADVRLAGARLIQANAQREQIKALVVKYQNDLHALTQQPVGGAIPVDTQLLSALDKETTLARLDKKAATVLQKQVDIEVARANSELTTSDMMPSLYARVDQDIVNANKNGSIPLDTRFSAVLEGNLEAGGFVGWKRLKSADAKVAAAQLDVETARNDVRRTAQSLLADRAMYQRVQRSNEQLVKSLEDTQESFMRQYDAGRKTWVDVLNNQRELSDARQELEQTKSSLLETGLRLSAMLGELDKEAGVQP